MVIVVGFIACAVHVALVVVGTPKAHTNVGDLHAGIKQSQLVALLQAPLAPLPLSVASTACCPCRFEAVHTVRSGHK